jgi:preprotein translocase subunit YajC
MHQPLTATAPLAGLLASSDDANAGGSIMSIGILLLIPIGMYFLLIRPQRRRAREQQALQKSIGVGDEVLTTSGIYGFVTAIESDSDVIWVEIDEDVQIRLTRGAISGKVNITTGGVDASVTDDDADSAAADSAAAPSARTKAASGRPTLKGTTTSAKEATTETEGAEPGDE